ncbi:ribosome small subunit-dependent GTPase A [Peptoanaerobacter stomatis]|uniref:Small ribosomal subunit biogenesis GTPase RsgA n=1 Tax=Peptoanaerobacter stomatis TaxID=796937 RepID=G9XG51_9FIRM|nr:ribosome small subunit-dependent GTPase A [Peptoanaerobacter stomatis]EHL15165.1 ribosome small subunit-dependent GTPase A [Peptoanaerobacter stomatis]
MKNYERWREIIKGLVIKKIADFFYVETETDVYESKPRGSFKKDKQNIIVGDYVDISILDEENKKAVVEKVYNRKNMLIRPSIANITKMILVFSVKNPKLNTFLIDNFLVIAEKEQIDVVICFSKIDLDEEKNYKNIIKIYQDIGYQTVEISSNDNIGIEDIKLKISGNITVIAGPSGAGKSSLINCISDRFSQTTSDISMKLQKGKNTTTYATLLEFAKNSYIADTPGFTSLKITDIDKYELKDYFLEFKKFEDDCKFASKCLHEHEPYCGVKNAVKNGDIQKSRYDSYLKILDDIKKFEKRRKY